MQNQAAVEALYSATFVEDYLDTVENLPNELQRHLSSLRELDLMLYKDFLCDLDSLAEAFEKETTSAGQRQILAKIQKGLIAAQDIGDDKLAVAQAMADTIENRARLLEHGAKNLDFEDDDDEEEQSGTVGNGSSNGVAGGNGGNGTPSATAALSTSSSAGGGGKQGGGGGAGSARKRQLEDKNEKSGKKQRKKQPQSEKHTPSRSDDHDEEESAATSSSASKSGSASGTKSRGSAGGAGNTRRPAAAAAAAAAAKKKQTGRRNQDKDNDSDREVDLNALDIDPDEPTYCLCDQVSYGDMIGCDNDLCPIEWFHFQCVQLTNKPKGKWYCPKCRGDKPTNMKPKAQFLKELEKFNKDREEKTMKQN